MKILSFHFGHDSSVCLYNNGVIEKYFLVERFTGKKHDSEIHKILKKIFLNFDERVDTLCVSTFNDVLTIEGTIISTIFDYYKKYNENLNLIINSDHHLNHASSLSTTSI